MKVFVYTKSKQSKHIITIKNVVQVIHGKDCIYIIDNNNDVTEFDTTKVKTRIYQN